MNPLFERLYGNDRLKKRLTALLAAGSLPHALILEGGEGSGRTTLATLLAEALACQEADPPCGVCDICHKIEEGICPDVITIDVPPERKFITVEQIRALREEAFIRPNDCEVKIFILQNAGQLNIQTQNMLLKILEEPPKNTYFFLLCTSSAALLPTVRSRAPVLKLQCFDEKELEEHLLDCSQAAVLLRQSDPTAFMHILQNAVGSLGNALKAIEKKGEKKGDAYDKAEALVSILCGKEPFDRADILLFVQKMGNNREDAVAFFDEFIKAVRDLTAVKKSRRRCRLVFFREMDKAAECAYALSARSLAVLCEQTLRIRGELADTNANLTLIKHTFADAVYSAV